MKNLWRKFKDFLIVLAIKGLAKLDIEKARGKLMDLLQKLKDKQK